MNRNTIKDGGAKLMNLAHRLILTTTGNRLLAKPFGMPLVELHTVGRKSGLPRSCYLTAPVHDDQRVVLIASKGGDDRNPDWYQNLQAHPDAANSGSPRTAPQLYYIALSTRQLEALRTSIRDRLGPSAWAPPSSMAVDDRAITTAIDVDAYWANKLEALAAHASQPDATELLRALAAHRDTPGKVEQYVRAYPPPQPGLPISTDLFS